MARVKTIERTVVASSLIEVTVSMLIIVMVFAMALTIYLNVTSSGSTLRKLRYRTYAADLAEKTKSRRDYLDESIGMESVNLTKRFSYYENNPHLLLMDIQVINEQDSVVYRQQELIYLYEQAD